MDGEENPSRFSCLIGFNVYALQEFYKRHRINRIEIGAWSTDCILPPDALQKISMVKMFDEKLEIQREPFLSWCGE
jgi:hypothetical protein